MFILPAVTNYIEPTAFVKVPMATPVVPGNEIKA